MNQTITVFAGFDGTGNNKYNDENKKVPDPNYELFKYKSRRV